MSSDEESVASAISDQEPNTATNGDLESDLDDDLFGDGDDEPIEAPLVLHSGHLSSMSANANTEK
jgi:hypothetical protein